MSKAVIFFAAIAGFAKLANLTIPRILAFFWKMLQI